MNFHFPLWPHFLWLISSSWVKSSQDKNEYGHFEEKSQTFFFFFFKLVILQDVAIVIISPKYVSQTVVLSSYSLLRVYVRSTEGNVAAFTASGVQHFPKLTDESEWRN